MSKTYINVRCDNDRWYRNPTWRDPKAFICFDDEDPPELVILKPHALILEVAESMALTALKRFGIKAELIDKSYFGQFERWFPSDPSVRRVRGKDFHKAFRFFLRIMAPPPPPLYCDAVLDTIPEGVLYQW